MNIQRIDILSKDKVIITTTDNQVLTYEKSKLKGPKRAWFDNIIACSISLVNYNPPK